MNPFHRAPAAALAAILFLAVAGLALVNPGSLGAEKAAAEGAKAKPADSEPAKTGAAVNAAAKDNAAAAEANASKSSGKDGAAKSAKYTTETLRGKVVWMSEALKRRFGVQTDLHSTEAMVVLESPQGELHPIVPDQRGRAFMVDPRLRDIDVELFVRRYEGSPFVQVIRVYHIKADGKYEVDYWCDLCAISMYILKQCECCQGPTRFRERLVEKDPAK